jgi:transcriptional regulator with XRE-family HTH domain
MTKDEFKSIREALALTQAEFGKLLGLSGVSVCKYELGKSKVPYSIAKLAEEISKKNKTIVNNTVVAMMTKLEEQLEELAGAVKEISQTIGHLLKEWKGETE